MAERKKILWLVSWYPNKYDAFDGDFIQRHARAAALNDDVHVIFVKASAVQVEVEETLSTKEGITEQIIYTPKQKSLAGQLKNYKRWKQTYKAAVADYIQTNAPVLVHVHIPWKAGLIALWIKKKYGIPFIVTEHWGIYNKVVADNINTKSFPVRYLLKRIYQQATAFVSVSKYLGEGVNETLVKKQYSVIPNVVDTSLFFPMEEKHSCFTILHVSNMVPLKNVEGLLKSFYRFLQTGANAQLILIGNKDHYYQNVAKNLGLPGGSVFFKGEVPYAEVAKEMQRSHVLVLNSYMENSPCVIGEALCCGLPVIATNVGGIPELVDEKNARLFLSNNENALPNQMKYVYDNYHEFDGNAIAATAAEKFSVTSIAKNFQLLYDSLAD